MTRVVIALAALVGAFSIWACIGVSAIAIRLWAARRRVQVARDCLELITLRLNEDRYPPTPPPAPPPLPPELPGLSAETAERLRTTTEIIQRAHQTYRAALDKRKRWESNELPKIRARRIELEMKLGPKKCEELQSRISEAKRKLAQR